MLNKQTMSQKLNFVVLLLTTLKVIEGFYLPGVVPRQFLPDELVGKLSFCRNVADDDAKTSFDFIRYQSE